MGNAVCCSRTSQTNVIEPVLHHSTSSDNTTLKDEGPTHVAKQQAKAPSIVSKVAAVHNEKTSRSTHRILEPGSRVSFEDLIKSKDSWRITDQAVFLQSCASKETKFRCNEGSILAETDQAAAAAAIVLANLTCRPQTALNIWCGTSQRKDGAFTAQDIEALYTANPRRWINFYRFMFTHDQTMVLSTIEQPIALGLNGSFPSGSISMLLDNILKRATKFGSLRVHYLWNENCRSLIVPLRQRRTVLFDELEVPLRGRGSADVGLTLLHCQHSIERLVLDCGVIRDGGFWTAVASCISEGLCPSRLHIVGSSAVPELEQVVQALASPKCLLHEMNIFPRAPAAWYVSSLAENKRLKRVTFRSTKDPKFKDDKLWQIITAHPTIQTVVVERCSKYTGYNSLHLSWLKENRRRRIIFEEKWTSDSAEKWRETIQPSMSFNRFYCAVADEMATMESPALCFRLALVRCMGDTRRMELLLRHHTSLLVEALGSFS